MSTIEIGVQSSSDRQDEGLLPLLSVAIVLVGTGDGVAAFANASALRLFGSAALLGRTLVPRGGDADRPCLDPEGMAPAFAGASRWRGDTTLWRADGTHTVVEIEGSVVSHALHGKVWCLECRDVGERREFEADLRARAARQRRVEIATGEGLWDWDINGADTHIAPRWFELLGYGPDDLPASVTTFLERVHPDDHASIPAVQGMAEGTTFDVELRLRHSEGDYRWYRSRGVYTCDAGIPRLTGLLSDISDRKRMEQRWQQAEQLAGLGAWERDFVKDRVWWSDVQRRINGVSPEASISQLYFLSLVHPDDRDAFERAHRDVLARGYCDTTYRIVRPDGRVRHVHGIAVLESDVDGRPLRMFGTNQDITDAVEAARRQQNTIAEKEALLREIHHRVRNNLAVVSSLMHFHAQRLESERDAETLARLCRRIKAMSLAHDQVQRGAVFGSVRLADYISELAFQLRNEHANDALVTIDADDIILPIEVAMPLGQILSELLANALTFGSEPRPGRVQMALRWREGNVEILIEDAGPGFPADFDPEHGGGFGWLLIRMLTKQIGGWARVESREGARVRIIVPSGDQDGKRQ